MLPAFIGILTILINRHAFQIIIGIAESQGIPGKKGLIIGNIGFNGGDTSTAFACKCRFGIKIPDKMVIMQRTVFGIRFPAQFLVIDPGDRIGNESCAFWIHFRVMQHLFEYMQGFPEIPGIHILFFNLQNLLLIS